MAPWKFFQMNMRWDAIWCILRHNLEKCCSLCTSLAVSGWFFRYSYLYSVMITIFFWGKLGIWGGSFYPSNTLDRILRSVTIQMKATERFLPVVLFIILYNVVLTFEPVGKMLKSDNSNVSHWAVLSCGTVYYAVRSGYNFWVCGWNAFE